MTKKEAYKLCKGDLITAVMGGELMEWPHDAILPGDVIVFDSIIPKVHIVKGFAWKDGHDEMIFGHMKESGKRAWLNFVNARRI